MIGVNKRTLTLKSMLKFGKYEDLTIANIINLGKGSYLRWVYYNYSGIDFMPDVLDMIQIPLDYRLEKPNKNPEMFDIVNDMAVEKHKFVYDISEELKEKRVKSMNILRTKKTNISKVSLVRKNHGHK